MIQITAEQVTPAIRSLFRTDEPQARRCFAALDGVPPAGKIFVDDALHPGFAVVQEPYEHSLYLGGEIDVPAFAELFASLRQGGYVLVGMWLDDPRIRCLPPNPDYDGRTLEFYDRPTGEGLEHFIHQVPADCTLQRLDRDSILLTEWGPNDVKMIGGLDIWERTCIGYGLLRDGEILADATVGLPAIGLYEPGVFTREDQRGKGYGTMVVARLIQELEALGGQTYWNCAKQNLPSAAIARKLGYRVEKEYRCMAWGTS